MTRDEQIIGLYKAGDAAKDIGEKFGVTARQVQRIVSKAGVSRTIHDSFVLAIQRGRMKYHHTPEHLKKHRKRLTDKLRYQVLAAGNYRCKLCGNDASSGYRIEVDHIDNDATHNELSNLQVLCSRCNKGKAWHAKMAS